MDGWEALVNMWTSDPDFIAKSIQNKANCGKEGTHNQGNRDFYRCKEKQVYIWNYLLFSGMFFF